MSRHLDLRLPALREVVRFLALAGFLCEDFPPLLNTRSQPSLNFFVVPVWTV
jgi:hypothetical protein